MNTRLVFLLFAIAILVSCSQSRLPTARHVESLDAVLEGIVDNQFSQVEKGRGYEPHLHRSRDAYRAGVLSTRLVELHSQDKKVVAEILLAITDTPDRARLRAKEIAAGCNKIGDTPDVSDIVGHTSYSNPACKIFSKANVVVFITARAEHVSVLDISRKIAENIR